MRLRHGHTVFTAVCSKGAPTSPLTTNLKAQLALIKLIEHDRSGEIHLDKFVAVLSGAEGREFQDWLENAPAAVMS